MLERSATALVLIALSLMPARADAVADFYKGKQVRLVVGYGPGGGYDVYARLIARHMGKYIPGSPAIIVQNMPGAGSLRAANYLYATAPKDGTVFGMFARDMPLLGVLGINPNVAFDPRRFTWLGSSSSHANDAYLFVVRKDAAVKTIEDARKPGTPPLILGGTGEGASANDVSLVLRETLGLNIKLVLGYPDSPALFMAVDRKELDGRGVGYSSLLSSKPEWLKAESGMRVLLQFGRSTRHPDFPDVPMARELARSEAARALIELAELPYALSRPFVAPPDVPSQRAQALQAAFLAVHGDARYLEEAARLKIDVSPIGNEAALRVIDRMINAPKGAIDALKRILTEGKGG